MDFKSDIIDVVDILLNYYVVHSLNSIFFLNILLIFTLVCFNRLTLSSGCRLGHFKYFYF
jgi:hypothetical protein